MDFEKAIQEYTYTRIEEVMLSSENKVKAEFFAELQDQVEKLGIDQNEAENLKRILFGLMDIQNQLIYRQGLADALDFLASFAETRHRLGI